MKARIAAVAALVVPAVAPDGIQPETPITIRKDTP